MYPLVPNSPPAPSLLFKCMKYENENENENDSYVYLKKPTEAIDYAAMPIEEYNTMEELLENPGVYTWLLMENGDFIARKAFTPAEVFSKHLNIYRSRVGMGILAAGECLIHAGRRVEFNLMSGTYMKHIGDKYSRRFGKNYEGLYVPQMTARWTAAGASNVVHVGSRGLLSDTVSDADLQPYLTLGFQKEVFADERACKIAENEEIEKDQNEQLDLLGGRRATRRSNRKSRRRLRLKYKSRRRVA